ncbi:uncharacterized protein LOC132199585 [Neocloeon triangulifer]|uniref:uncharacterized protein LOC132199585 n=1 Tax=Neocloeon triangulifer TaxID=2078957 RepID=UPI00286F2DBE|nr:uncharacterized protein LOC132199585 [Neocloeon triangulifer]
MKLLAVLACLVSASLGLFVLRDLAADIASAERAVNLFNTQVESLLNRISTLESELNNDVTNTCTTILSNLAQINVTNYDEIENLLGSSKNQSDVAISGLKFNLEQTILLLQIINGNLANDLPSLGANVESLKAYISTGDSIYSSLFAQLQDSTVTIEQAITAGVGDLQGPEVTTIFVRWTHVKDVILNQRVLTDNVKLVYDTRGENAVNALDIVVAQVPQ